jgi:HEXXH motif-containing protein
LVSEPSTRAHTLPRETYLNVVGAAGTAGDVAHLADTERSWRMVSLLYVIDTLADAAPSGPLEPVDDARKLLIAADEADRQAASEVALYPMAGIWISHLLRRLRGLTDDDHPLWLDAGYLHGLAAAAAIRAGIDFTLHVPVRDGAVVLPSLGMAAFPGLDVDAAEVRHERGRTVIRAGGRTVRPAGDDAGWRAMPRVRSDVDGSRISFTIDDVDPYRDLRGYSAPAPLGAADLRRWQQTTDDAWRRLVGQDRDEAERVAAALHTVVPLPAAEAYRPLSASCDEAFATVMASMPDDAAQLAVTLVHETQHVILGAMTHLFEFVDDPGGPLVYAPWRDDPRPLAGMLQGSYAFVGVTGHFRARPEPVARFEFALWRHQLERVLTGLGRDGRLSGHGRELIAGLAATVAGWAGTAVPPEILALATAAARDHYGQWRALHLAAPPDWVERAVEAWTGRRPCPAAGDTDPAPVTDTSARWLDGRAVLARVRLEDPSGFAVLVADPASVARRVPGTVPADVALIAGDPAAALDGYRRQLHRDPGDHRAWIGLGLARDALGRPSPALARRPELVRALARRLPGADPIEVADWCADALLSC